MTNDALSTGSKNTESPSAKPCHQCRMNTHFCSNCGERIQHGEDECEVCVSVGTVQDADPS